MKELRRLLPGELTFGWLLLAASLFLFYQSYQIAGFSSISSGGGTPLAASGLMILCSVVVIVRNMNSPALEAGWSEAARRFQKEILPPNPLIGYVLIIIAFMAALEPLGFNLSSWLFLFVSFLYLHRKGGLWLATWLSVVSVFTIFVVFQLLFQVTLPEGDWLEPFYRLIGR
jgi:putative tricarboxylic transport membrane protein